MGDVVVIGDLIRALPWDSLARLTSDPNMPHELGHGDGVQTTWDTPFQRATTLRGYVDGSVVAGVTLSRGTGAGGVDQITFATPPGAGAVVAVTADGLAVNVAVLSDAIEDAEAEGQAAFARVGRDWPPTGDALVSEQRPLEDLSVAILRERRGLEQTERDKRAWAHFDDISKGKLKLPADAPAVATKASGPALLDSMTRVFDGELI